MPKNTKKCVCNEKGSGFLTTIPFQSIRASERVYNSAGNTTKGGSITVPLTSCLPGLESAV